MPDLIIMMSIMPHDLNFSQFSQFSEFQIFLKGAARSQLDFSVMRTSSSGSPNMRFFARSAPEQSPAAKETAAGLEDPGAFVHLFSI